MPRQSFLTSCPISRNVSHRVAHRVSHRVARFALKAGPILGLTFLAACGSTNDAGPAATADASGTANQTASALPSSDIAANSLPELQRQLHEAAGDRVFFETDHWDLTAADQATLQRQAAWLQQHPAVSVTIAGHSDERGTRDYNLALGERRATATSNFLAALGIDHSRMTVISYGKEQPECGDATENCWTENRRAVTLLATSSQ